MKKVNTIYESTEYDLFRPHQLNRLESPKPKLLASMRQDGFMDAYPIHVVKKWSHYVIKAGHHRFAAARQLGIPVKFIITEEDGKLPQQYEPESRWTPKDIMDSYAKAGNKHYQYLQKYVKAYGIPVNVATQILSSNKSGRVQAQMRLGQFEPKDIMFAEKVGEIVAHCARFLPYARSKLFALSVATACKLDGFDPERFMSKVESHHQIMKKRPDTTSYIEEFEKVYNRNARQGDIVPLSVFYRR